MRYYIESLVFLVIFTILGYSQTILVAHASGTPSLGSHSLAWYPCNTTPQSLVTSPLTTQASGSTLLAWVARGVIGNFTSGTIPTDTKGNTFSMLGTVHDYGPYWSNSGEAMYAVPSAVGGANHTFTTQMIDPDEVTFSVIEVKNGGIIQDVKWNKVLHGSPNTSASVTTTGPATLIALWAGDGAQENMTAVPNNGFTVIESQLINTTCAIQTVIASKEVTAGTYNVTWTTSPVQGAHLWLIAVQGAGSKVGDLDRDGDVDIFDYNRFVSKFGQTGTPGWIIEDLDINGLVNLFDYNILITNFGR